jgi:hypothetical protein
MGKDEDGHQEKNSSEAPMQWLGVASLGAVFAGFDLSVRVGF